MAEGLMKKRLKELGKDHIKVFSAGTGAMDGFAPTDETIEVMKMENIDVSGYRSKHITEYIIKNSDLILVMEEAHKTLISEIAPEARSKTYLLKE
jgi:protein-tyrosine phosphatase